MGKGNLLDFGIKMNGILAHQVHKSDGGTFRKRDPVANRHGAYQFRQVAGLRRGAVDHRGFAVLCNRLYRRVFFASFSATRASTVVSQGASK